MEVEGAGGFEDAVEFEQAVGHHDQVGHHIGLVEEFGEGVDEFGYVGVGLVEDLVEFVGGLVAPVPGIFEGGYLGIGLVTFGGIEVDVVVTF